MTIRTLIVDDEPLAREGMRMHLKDAEDIEVVGECGDGEDAVIAIDALAPDLVFLDVQMPGLDGFGVIEAVGTGTIPAVVFVTAHEEFAVRAFDAHALDYVLKPVEPERLQRALQRVRAQLENRNGEDLDTRLRALLGKVRPQGSYVERLAVRAGGRISFVRTADIDWVAAEGNYARIHAAGATHLIRETMNALETRLDPERFVRIHRSTIVNSDRIQELEPLFQGDYLIILRDGTRLPSSRAYRDRLRRFIEG